MMMSFSTTDSEHHSLLSFSVFLFFLLCPSYGLNIDGTLLLSFKYSILDDPLSVLDNWDYNDATPCLWTGVTCAPDMFRVTSLVLPNSKLLGSIPAQLGFIQHLHTVDLSNNFFNGTLPISLFTASELQVLSLSNNAISGEIPESIGGLKSLKLLNLSVNAFTGNVPLKLSSLQNLTVVSLRNNFFSGTIPSGFQFVEVLDLSSNLLNGTLPDEFGGDSLKYLNLSSNKLSGLVSPQFAKKIPANATIDLSFNNLTGELPESIALSNQKTEFFAGNIDLCGKPLKKLCTIPSTLSSPPNVTTNTSSPAIAAIPKEINSTPLQDSARNTESAGQNQPQHGLKPGTIVGIIVGDLAGVGVLAIVFLYVYKLKKKKASEANIESSIDKDQKYNRTPEPAVLVLKQKNTTTTTRSSSLGNWPCLTITNGEETSATDSDTDDNKNQQVEDEVEYEMDEKKKKERSFVMVDGETELELETLLKASAYILGSSGASIVYKAVLEDGTAFAVRRIGENGVGKLKEFEQRVKAINKLRHPNLVRIRGFYWGDDEKLIIYDYVSNGSLANVGYRKVGSSPYFLPYEVRLKIAKGIARGLTYIHEKKHVHGNIKPSNILLTQDMEPIISDHGLHGLMHGKNSCKPDHDNSARHFGSKRSTSSRDGLHDQPTVHGSPYIAPAGFVGCTSPYHAPESLQSLKPSPKWDVYSFGIVLLELLTGKVFSDRELSQWTTGSVGDDKNRVLRMTDVAIKADVESKEETTVSLFKLGFSCASLNPQKRPTMKDALHMLDKVPGYSHY